VNMKTYSYAIEDEDYMFTFETPFDIPSCVAEAAARDFFSEHDGWEASWPIEFSIFNVDDGFIGAFKVYCESVPQFSASGAV
jgi:hypothetical protein